MKNYSLGLAVALMLAGNAVFAQKVVMMGKVTDNSGKPIAGATIKVSGHKTYYKVKTDADGLYNTPLIDPVSYHILIDANNNFYTTEKVKVEKPGDVKEFYNFILSGNQAEARIERSGDPAMIARLERMEADLNRAAELAAPKKEAVVITSDEPENTIADKKDEPSSARRGRNRTSVKRIPGAKDQNN